jgi:hypothetical protein
MPNTNPQLYKVATQQLKVLRTLAKMSVQIGDREGTAILQAAETAIDSPVPRLAYRFDSIDYRSCRDEAAQLLGDCQ